VPAKDSFHTNAPLSLANRLRRYDKLPQPLFTVVRRITDGWVEPRAVVQNTARVCVRPESPLAVIFAHSGVADAAEWQIMEDRLKGAVVDAGIPRCRRVQDLLGYGPIVREQVKTERARPRVDEVDHFPNVGDLQDR
jgi:hypothetical protein